MTTHADLGEAAHRLQLQIAIDGPAGAGKSTVGRGLAEVLACPYLDTGIMYRAVTLAALRLATPLMDAGALAGVAGAIEFSWSGAPPADLCVDGSPPVPGLRSASVDAAVSQVSAHPQVRAVLVARQRELARSRCVVMVGRDIGTVVLPEAPVKLWVTASLEERARRRQSQLGSGDGEIAGSLRERDRFDSGRATSPAVPASDAFVLDTGQLSPDESVRAAIELVRAAVEREQASAR